jgi:hypothetical protein
MAAYQKFNAFVEKLGRGAYNLNTVTIKGYLTNATPAGTDTNKGTAPAEITAGNGYTAGGVTVSLPGYSQTAGVGKLSAVASDPVITASGGTIGPFRYLVLNESVSGDLIAFFDYGSALTLNSGESLTIDADQTNGLFTLA